MDKKAYFINIAGTTMAGLALALKNIGWDVLGSDQKKVYPPVTTFLEENNIKYFKGYSEDNLSFVPDLVVVGRSALMIDPKNPEYLKAKKLGCPVLSYPEVLREYLIKENSIVVAGTYGKTTTVALIVWILINAGASPSFMIGGIPLNFNDGTRITNSKYSVVEGDETPALLPTDLPKFMFYKPKYLLLTATEYDHPEIYKTQTDYLNAYINLVKLLPGDAVLMYDPFLVDEEVINAAQCRKITYLKDSEINLDESFKESALRALTLCKELNISQKVINDSFASFKGLKTRQELLGKFGGRFWYQDLSQQPSKVKRVLRVLKERYPKSKITVVFNPSATSLKYKESLEGFPEAFFDAEQVIVAKVDYLRDIPSEKRVTGPDLVKAFGGERKIVYEPVDENIIERLRRDSKEGDVIVFMSSGGLRFINLIEKMKKELGGVDGRGEINGPEV